MLVVVAGRRRAALAALLLVVSCAALCLRLRAMLEYTPASRVEVSLGEGDGQVPAVLSRGGELFGVRAFAPGPDGSVYVVDCARGRVLKYDGTGELLGVLETGRGRMAVDDVCVMEDGSVVLADNSAVAAVRVSGERPPSIVWAGKRVGAPTMVIESVRPAGESLTDGVYVSYSAWGKESFSRTLSLVRPDGVERKMAECVVSSPGAAGDCPVAEFSPSVNGGYHTLLMTGTPFTRVVRLAGDGGDAGPEFMIVSERAMQSVTLLGDDRRGMIYAGVDLGTPDGRVLVIDRSGRVAVELAAPHAARHRSSTYARVDSAGNVFVLEQGEYSAAIRRLQVRRRWTVGLRGRDGTGSG